ncbi:alkaline phosphatase family protein [Xylanibacter muris]|uniref:Alkaline phosphatase family protein n=1 Tax=Xylanibacter muris TaxID=2736290 RepID=A0ABX2AJT4_9BACT|nr:alkaline phosphatase family protein [Xylanibacter muris]NPD91269.1 alkaline phosphatase family protein [Xylanibacter muris]
MKYKHIPISFLAVLVAAINAQAQTISQAPKMVVSINIDQLRSDYLDAFAPLYGNEGFKKLLEQGIVYTNASYPFAPIDRASATASMATGTTPYYNGIVGRQWLNKETLRPEFCTDDNTYKGVYTKDCSSPKRLYTSTLADELKVATAGKAVVFSVAPFRDAAVFSAGHAANGAIWIDDNSGYWCTSEYYGNKVSSWISSYNSVSSPRSRIDNRTWEPENRLSGNFSYFLSGGMQKPFSHKFTSPRKYREFKTSGLVNEDVTSTALQCMRSNAMGSDAITDLLYITYYAGNFDHKPTNECQMELQDTYVKLDKEIARLLKEIDKSIGLDNVMVVMASSGYADEDDADYGKYNVPTGTFNISRTANLLNIYLGAVYGMGQYVDTCFGPQIFINHKLLEDKQISLTQLTERAQEFLSMLSGVRNVYTSQQLLSSHNELITKTRNGFNPQRNGDIIIEINPGWHLVNDNNMENKLSRESFIQFPIIFFKTGLKPEHISTPVTVDRIAPTVAKAIRIRAPNACSSQPLF